TRRVRGKTAHRQGAASERGRKADAPRRRVWTEPGGLGVLVAVRRQATEEGHAQLTDRGEQRARIVHRKAGCACRRNHEMVGRLVLVAVALQKLAAGEQHLEYLPDISAGRQKPAGKSLHQRRRRFVRDKVLRQFEADVAGRRRASRQDVERLFAFGLASRAQLVTK